MTLYPQHHASNSTLIHGEFGHYTKTLHSRRIAILITTFQRPKSLAMILNSLQAEAKSYHIEYFIFDDAVTNNGKHKFWITINSLWERIKGIPFDYYIHIPDDFILCHHFISEVIHLWDTIDDPLKIGLNIFLDQFRIGKKVWVDEWPELRNFHGNRFLLNPWLDMAFICNRNLFEQLDWRINPISMERWRQTPTLSSGVGAQISIRLYMKGYHMYQVTRSLADHIGIDSKMNPEIRKKEPLISFNLPLIFVLFDTGKDSNTSDLNHSILIRYVDKIIYFVQKDSPPPLIDSYYVDKVSVFIYPNNQIDLTYKVNSLKSFSQSDFYLFHNTECSLYSGSYIWDSIRQMEDGYTNIDCFMKIKLER